VDTIGGDKPAVTLFFPGASLRQSAHLTLHPGRRRVHGRQYVFSPAWDIWNMIPTRPPMCGLEETSSTCARKSLCIQVQQQRPVTAPSLPIAGVSELVTRPHSPASFANMFGGRGAMGLKVSCHGTLYIWNSRGSWLPVFMPYIAGRIFV